MLKSAYASCDFHPLFLYYHYYYYFYTARARAEQRKKNDTRLNAACRPIGHSLPTVLIKLYCKLQPYFLYISIRVFDIIEVAQIVVILASSYNILSAPWLAVIRRCNTFVFFSPSATILHTCTYDLIIL